MPIYVIIYGNNYLPHKYNQKKKHLLPLKSCLYELQQQGLAWHWPTPLKLLSCIQKWVYAGLFSSTEDNRMQYFIRHDQQRSYCTTQVTVCLIKCITGIMPTKFAERFHNSYKKCTSSHKRWQWDRSKAKSQKTRSRFLLSIWSSGHLTLLKSAPFLTCLESQDVYSCKSLYKG